MTVLVSHFGEKLTDQSDVMFGQERNRPSPRSLWHCVSTSSYLSSICDLSLILSTTLSILISICVCVCVWVSIIVMDKEFYTQEFFNTISFIISVQVYLHTHMHAHTNTRANTHTHTHTHTHIYIYIYIYKSCGVSKILT